MATNFFKGLEHLFPGGDWIINIKAEQDGIKTVSVLPVSAKVEDTSVKTLPPMVLKGTPAELDNGFFEAIKTPVEKTIGLFNNLAGYEQALEKAKTESRMEKDKQNKDKQAKDKEKAAASEKTTRYDAQMKKVQELVNQKKIGEAIGQLPKPADFPDKAEEIKTKDKELRGMHSELSLF